MTETEPRVHWHTHRDKDSGARFAGRAHLTVNGIGRRSPYPNHEHSCGVGAEVRLLPNAGSSFGWGLRARWGTNASETTPDFTFHAGRLGDVWVQFERVVPWRWLERHRPDGKADYDTRVFGVTVARDHVSWDCWSREGNWSRSDPWWMHQYHRWDRLLFGKHETTTEAVDSGVTMVEMPERWYGASYTVRRVTKRWMGPLGRLRDRVVGVTGWTHVEVEVPEGVPIPGKGENSWDCDDDKIFSVSGPGSDVRSAVAMFRDRVLEARAQYGGQHMSEPHHG